MKNKEFIKNKNKKAKANKKNNNFISKSDPQGSYTGCCKNNLEKPVQDADDL